MQLVNTMLISKGKNFPESKLVITQKDKDGNKSFKYIENVKFEFYHNKPEFKGNNMVNFIEPEKVEKVECRYDDLYKAISELCPNLKTFYAEAISSGEFISSKLRRMHLDFNLHGSDKNIVDFYISKFYRKYDPDKHLYGIKKAFYDIEVDGSEIVGFPDPEVAAAPINVITLVIDTGHVYSFCLKYDTDNYKETMSHKEELLNDLKEKYKDSGLNLTFDIREYDCELDLIKGFFNVINIDEKPDFVLAWNASFDNTTIVNRIKNLNGSPEDICCPEELAYKRVNINLDKRNSDPSEKTDIFEIGGYSVWLDMMALYANLRKSKKEESYALDYIGGKLLGIHKDKVEGDIKTFHFTDYYKFLLYNIQDAIMLLQIENKNKDIDLFQKVASLTETRITHALKKTISLRNLADKFYREQNLIISNNRARLWNKEEGIKITGAFVGDPNNTDYNGVEINGTPSKYWYESVIDFDLSSLYPSIILALNISPETCFGKISIQAEIDNEVQNEENLVSDYMSGDSIAFGHKWLDYPDLEEMLAIIDNEIA